MGRTKARSKTCKAARRKPSRKGEGPAEGAGAKIRLISANVTMLTRQRLDEVLCLASAEQAHIIAVQETKHPPGGFPWAERTARKAGWKAAWSKDSGIDPIGRRRQGGTLLLTKTSLGRNTFAETNLLTHRVAARVFADFCVFAVYADAQRADLDAARKWQDEAEQSGK